MNRAEFQVTIVMLTRAPTLALYIVRPVFRAWLEALSLQTQGIESGSGWIGSGALETLPDVQASGKELKCLGESRPAPPSALCMSHVNLIT